ncbi:hypothetical protein [Cognatishimia sp. F0-27]|uniref:hypothetical protein n=1 Tax=Cognatishimia sp. F0-27 TaxID=2816855 RepID=UPI001D0C7350|nr:hypothetical protein [Cognatishimia sp. F0-27]MCC1494060.1 hypothetical protein [Cognatishimia sp. F0-27]
MAGKVEKPTAKEASPVRSHPAISVGTDGAIDVCLTGKDSLVEALGMKTREAAEGVFMTAIEGLGGQAQDRAAMLSAMFAEIEPRDAVEAMLVAQMTATHVAITEAAKRHSFHSNVKTRESLERSMTRLSRTYLAQMAALKKYRSKVQQVVRVERVTVEDGGRAIVGNVEI